MTFKPEIVPLGDSTLLVRLGEEIDLAVNRRVHALASLIHASSLEGVIETVPAYTTVVIHYDPVLLPFAEIHWWALMKLEQLQDAKIGIRRQIEVPVRYGGEYGIDLEFVARYHARSVDDVIRIHTAGTYTVYMMGFTPGFPYMGKLDDAIVTPRLETPRTRVPAGTVAIGGSQTGIYPIDSPGGWRLIGHTPLRLFDAEAEDPFLFSPGDEVRFVAEG